jgi:putative ABC transport system substrate-binding protein
VRRIGYLSGSPPLPATDAQLTALRQGLTELGYVEGRNLVIEARYADGRLERLPELARELVELHVEVISAPGTPQALAARSATVTIPIVIATSGDPTAEKLVESVAHPGGNVTGLTSLAGELMAKRVQILKETVPSARRLGALINANISSAPSYAGFLKGIEVGTQATGLELLPWGEVRAVDGLESAFGQLMSQRPDVLMSISDPMMNGLRPRVAELSLKAGLPVMADAQESCRAGMLMSYGANLLDNVRRSAVFVDKILRGADPAELPLERPSAFDFVINVKTARALDLAIPSTIQAQASEIIQ